MAKKKPCPTCGTCPTCGAAKPVEIVRYIAQPYPVYMWPYSPLPYYTPPVYPIITYGLGASSDLGAGLASSSLALTAGT
jgi:hypothetical protein